MIDLATDSKHIRCCVSRMKFMANWMTSMPPSTWKHVVFPVACTVFRFGVRSGNEATDVLDTDGLPVGKHALSCAQSDFLEDIRVIRSPESIYRLKTTSPHQTAWKCCKPIRLYFELRTEEQTDSVQVDQCMAYVVLPTGEQTEYTINDGQLTPTADMEEGLYYFVCGMRRLGLLDNLSMHLIDADLCGAKCGPVVVDLTSSQKRYRMCLCARNESSVHANASLPIECTNPTDHPVHFSDNYIEVQDAAVYPDQVEFLCDACWNSTTCDNKQSIVLFLAPPERDLSIRANVYNRSYNVTRLDSEFVPCVTWSYVPPSSACEGPHITSLSLQCDYQVPEETITQLDVICTLTEVESYQTLKLSVYDDRPPIFDCNNNTIIVLDVGSIEKYPVCRWIARDPSDQAQVDETLDIVCFSIPPGLNFHRGTVLASQSRLSTTEYTVVCNQRSVVVLVDSRGWSHLTNEFAAS
ncbi:unnamed protein product [Dicrocoelium dendriticum]|nr:unnamed protein product [Dicrocoelium dendriticum]